MSMFFVSIPTELDNRKSKIVEFVEKLEYGNERMLDIDKSWEGIGYLLAGVTAESQVAKKRSPFRDAIYGGISIGGVTQYGPYKHLNSDRVKKIANALKSVSSEEFASQFNAKDFSNKEIYPVFNDWTEEDKGYLVLHYENMMKFYCAAAEKEESLVLYVR